MTILTSGDGFPLAVRTSGLEAGPVLLLLAGQANSHSWWDAGPAVVYGTSMGGRVAQLLAADNPQLVRRLVLACTSPGGPYARERTPEVRQRLATPDRDARRRSCTAATT